MHSEIKHPKDIEYFTEYPSSVMESIHSTHFTNINHTIQFFGPMLYFLARAIESHQIIEVGHAEGYTSRYLAQAVKDNGLRYQVTSGMYYGIDIVQTEKVRDALTKLELPNTIINMDSINLNKDTFSDNQFDLIFQDGAHDEEHVLHELEVLYPKLKGDGKGYWIAHDVYGPSEEGYVKILKMIPKKYNFEFCRIWSSSYGLGIFRKMDGYDYNKRYWRE